jgi:enamine deaminase RidA (YjgF/YER057c/UK114 family)
VSAPRILLPPGWPQPQGYAHGVLAAGEYVFVGGQIGWDQQGRFAEGLAGQVGLALRSIAEILAVAGATPQSIVRLTWFVVDVEDYIAQRPAIGRVYREVMGRHFPAMSVIGVSRLVEREALVEIEATAVVE